MSCFPICFEVCQTTYGFNMGPLFWVVLIMGAFIGWFAVRIAMWLGKYKVIKKSAVSNPHYSVAELEKIRSWLQKYCDERGRVNATSKEFIEFLKDRKKVDEILDER